MALSVVFLAFALAAPAHAAFPGQSGKIAFSRCTWSDADLMPVDDCDIWTMNADGTGQTNITHTPSSTGRLSEEDPSWSPDGTKIAFVTKTVSGAGPFVYTMNADGSGVTLVIGGTSEQYGEPDWSPDGSSLVYSKQSSSSSPWHIWRANADGTQQTQLTFDPVCCGSALDRQPNWSPDGSEIEYLQSGGRESLMNADGSNQRVVGGAGVHDAQWSPNADRVVYAYGCCSLFTAHRDFSSPAQVNENSDGVQQPDFSPDGGKIVFAGSTDVDMQPFHIHVTDIAGTVDTALTSDASTWDQQPDWQPLPITSYPRPKGASPIRISLVPAYPPCTSPDTTHGAPLAFGSCSHPQLASQYLTVGTPDVNGKRTTMEASILLKVVTSPSADVKINTIVNNVFNKNLSDYTGGLRAHLPLQITDKDNTPSPGGPAAATTEPLPFDFDLSCTATTDTTTGSDCPLSTTANALVPGSVTAGLRAVWQVGQAQVYDGGADGNPDTMGDNTLYLDQGIFVP